jgi:hypothetical protein
MSVREEGNGGAAQGKDKAKTRDKEAGEPIVMAEGMGWHN